MGFGAAAIEVGKWGTMALLFGTFIYYGFKKNPEEKTEQPSAPKKPVKEPKNVVRFPANTNGNS